MIFFKLIQKRCPIEAGLGICQPGDFDNKGIVNEFIFDSMPLKKEMISIIGGAVKNQHFFI